MVMMLGEIFGQLVTRELVAREHPMHDARFLEHDKVAIHRTLREIGTRRENLRNRERSRRVGQHVDDDATMMCKPLSVRAQ